MDFLRKNYEKVALAAVSVLLIVSAIVLMGKLTFGGDEDGGDDKANRSPAKALDTNELAKVSLLLKRPPQWAGSGPKPLLPTRWEWVNGELVPAGKAATAAPEQVIHELDWVVTYKTFPMVFKGIATGTGENAVFQINIAGGSSEFKRIGQSIFRRIGGVDEEFKLVKFDEKKIKQRNPRTGGTETLDASELTVTRKTTRETIVLVMGQPRMESDMFVSFYSRVTGERSGELKKGGTLLYKGKQFKLLDIAPRQLLIEDPESGEKYRKTPRSIQRQ